MIAETEAPSIDNHSAFAARDRLPAVVEFDTAVCRYAAKEGG
jgi:hypothetical protein